MKIDVVICTYNRCEKLRKAIQSVLDAQLPENHTIQLIIVNNNSTDDTERVIKEFANNGFIGINHLTESKQGKSHALNTALLSISGDLIAFTDDDVLIDKLWLREIASAAKKYPEYSCFGGKVVAVYPEQMPGWLDLDGSMKFVRSALVDRDDGDREEEYSIKGGSQTPGGCNMFFRRAAIEKNGLFRTDLGPVGRTLGFAEDTEYCRRLLEAGEKFMYIPSAIIYHPAYKERLRKDYLLQWQYKCGRSEVRRNGGYAQTKKIAGVPRYLFKKCIQHALGWSLSLQIRKRFYHKLRLYYTFGEIEEHYEMFNKRQQGD